MKPSDWAFENILALLNESFYFFRTFFSIYNDHIFGSFSHQLFKIFSKGPQAIKGVQCTPA